jgi:hypothetical protein
MFDGFLRDIKTIGYILSVWEIGIVGSEKRCSEFSSYDEKFETVKRFKCIRMYKIVYAICL